MKTLKLMSLILAFILIFTACAGGKEEIKESEIGEASESQEVSSEAENAEAADVKVEIIEQGSAEPQFIEEGINEEFAVFLKLKTDKKIENLAFFAAEMNEDDKAGFLFKEGEALFKWDSLDKDGEIVIETEFPGDLPSRGFSYDDMGEHRAFLVYLSGMDGSLVVEEIKE